MSFTSLIYPKELIIDDSNAHRHIPRPGTIGRGYNPRNWSEQPRGSIPYSRDVPFKNLPRSVWDDAIKWRQDNSLVSEVLLNKGVPSLNQDRTNYCWTNAFVTGMMADRCLRNLPFILLSPASVAAQVKRYSNSGGYAMEACQFIAENGIMPASLWPQATISRQYATPANLLVAKQYMVQDFFELNPYDFDQLVTLVLMGFQVAFGLNWWSHEICAIDVVKLGNNSYGIRFRNSWGDSYGEHGFSILTEAKCNFGDACCPVIQSASPAILPPSIYELAL